MRISSFEARGVRFELSSEAPWPKFKKVRTLSFVQLLKCEKAKCPYFFIFGLGAEILKISSSDDSSNLIPQASNKEMVISRLLGPKSKNCKTHYRSESSAIFCKYFTNIS